MSELLAAYAFEHGQMLEWIRLQHEPDHNDARELWATSDCDVCQFLARLGHPDNIPVRGCHCRDCYDTRIGMAGGTVA